MKLLLLMCLYALYTQDVLCQIKDSTISMQVTALQNYNNLSSKTLNSIDKKYTTLTSDVNSKTVKLLIAMQKQETSLKQKMWGIDSNKAKEIFAGAQIKYQQFASKLSSTTNPSILHPLKEYIPGLDSMQTAMGFMQNANTKLPGILSSSKLQQIQSITTQTQALEGKLQSANEIQDYVRARSQALKDQLTQYGLGKQLLGMIKQVYYYQQQLTAYKGMLNDKKALEQKALTTIEGLPAFQNFMAKNSLLARVFGAPGSTPNLTTAAAGLQTRAQISSIVSQRLGAIGSNTDASAYLAQQVTGGQDQLAQLKNKLKSVSGNSSVTMPDFEPNDQKTKSFLKRLEYGFNFQSTKPSGFLPSTSDIGLTLGYKLNDKATIGTGLSYKLGWGAPISHITLSNQGLGVRSYMDIKTKGSIWLTGGFEYNYYSEFATLHDVTNFNASAWQKSTLIGITKKYKVGKKTGNMQLLYDLLANQELPQKSPLKFRVGYSF